jgi:hypothetical protein
LKQTNYDVHGKEPKPKSSFRTAKEFLFVGLLRTLFFQLLYTSRFCIFSIYCVYVCV